MKNISIIICLFLMVIQGNTQGCIPSSIVFSNQAAVDNFRADFPGCTMIEGSLGITGSVVNVDSLIDIVEIG